jgi:DNA-binding YbaB/EbfC family protein
VLGIKELMQQAQNLQSKVTEIQEQLAEKIVTGSAGGDMVTVDANGAQEIISINIEESLVASGDTEMLQDLVTAAVNDALRRSRELATEEMSKITGGLRIPGLT